MKISCIIVDDEPTAIKSLEAVVKKIHILELRASFTDSLEALDIIKEQPVDLLFLDVNMEGLTGLELIKLVDCKVIFTTAHKRHVHEALDHPNTVDYLEKPISFARLATALKKVENNFIHVKKPPAEGGDGLLAKTELGARVIPFASILRVKSAGYFSTVYYEEQSGEMKVAKVRESLSSIEHKCPGSQFLRIHKSHIINRKRVVRKIYNRVILENGESLPIGIAFKHKLG